MLILGRQVGERVIVETESGEIIAIQVMQFNHRNGGKPTVRLGFECSRMVKVDREEIRNVKLKMETH